jgi:hypothetical protein
MAARLRLAIATLDNPEPCSQAADPPDSLVPDEHTQSMN